MNRATSDEFRDLLKELGYKQTQYSKLVRLTDRQVRRWASGESPVTGTDTVLLRMMTRLQENPDLLQTMTVQELVAKCAEIEEGE